jgi:hypothetical protein
MVVSKRIEYFYLEPPSARFYTCYENWLMAEEQKPAIVRLTIDDAERVDIERIAKAA